MLHNLSIEKPVFPYFVKAVGLLVKDMRAFSILNWSNTTRTRRAFTRKRVDKQEEQIRCCMQPIALLSDISEEIALNIQYNKAVN